MGREKWSESKCRRFYKARGGNENGSFNRWPKTPLENIFDILRNFCEENMPVDKLLKNRGMKSRRTRMEWAEFISQALSQIDPLGTGTYLENANARLKRGLLKGLVEVADAGEWLRFVELQQRAPSHRTKDWQTAKHVSGNHKKQFPSLMYQTGMVSPPAIKRVYFARKEEAGLLADLKQVVSERYGKKVTELRLPRQWRDAHCNRRWKFGNTKAGVTDGSEKGFIIYWREDSPLAEYAWTLCRQGLEDRLNEALHSRPKDRLRKTWESWVREFHWRINHRERLLETLIVGAIRADQLEEDDIEGQPFHAPPYIPDCPFGKSLQEDPPEDPEESPEPEEEVEEDPEGIEAQIDAFIEENSSEPLPEGIEPLGLE